MDHFRQLPGLGAGWFEFEHNSLGYEFGTYTNRFEKLEEVLQIVIPLLCGEQKTLRMVAQYGDESNLSSGSIDEIPRKLAATGRSWAVRVSNYTGEIFQFDVGIP